MESARALFNATCNNYFKAFMREYMHLLIKYIDKMKKKSYIFLFIGNVFVCVFF